MSVFTPAAVWSVRVLAPASPIAYIQTNEATRPASVSIRSGVRGVFRGW